MVEGAQRAHVNLARRNPRACELIVRRPPQVEMRIRVAREPVRCLRVRRKLAGEIGTDFVTARTDARTNRRDDVFRARAVSRRQCLNSDAHRTGGRPLPAGVNRRDGAGSAIGEENRHTVGHPNADGDSRIVGDRDICFGPVIVGAGSETGIVSPAWLEHIGAMHVAHAHEGIERYAQRTRDIPPACHSIRANAFEFQFARAEDVRGHDGERRATERRSPWLLHPLKLAARLWKGHVDKYYRRRTGCH
jgi:hypothetical protein